MLARIEPVDERPSIQITHSTETSHVHVRTLY
jgi:hypothetical protein